MREGGSPGPRDAQGQLSAHARARPVRRSQAVGRSEEAPQGHASDADRVQDIGRVDDGARTSTRRPSLDDLPDAVVSLSDHVAMQRKRAVLALHPLAGDHAQYRLAVALDRAMKIGPRGVAPRACHPDGPASWDAS